MEFSFLYALQELNNAFLDPIMIVLSTLGNSGFIWIVVAIVLLCTKKYREYGVAVGIALLLSLLICNVALKNIVERSRPFWIDDSISLKIEAPNDFSFPSGHTFSSFAAAVALLFYDRRMGAAAVILAIGIAFSRLYLFVHFPTDVLAAVILGSASAVLAVVITRTFLRSAIQKTMRLGIETGTAGADEIYSVKCPIENSKIVAGATDVLKETTVEGEKNEFGNDQSSRQ